MAKNVDATKSMGGGVPFKGAGRLFVLENTVDIDDLVANSAFVSADVIQAIPVSDGMRVMGTELEMVTPSDDGTGVTADIGDGDDPNGFDAAVDLKGVAGTITATAIGTDAYGASGKRYAAADTIDVIPTYQGSPTVYGKFKIRAWGMWMK